MSKKLLSLHHAQSRCGLCSSLFLGKFLPRHVSFKLEQDTRRCRLIAYFDMGPVRDWLWDWLWFVDSLKAGSATATATPNNPLNFIVVVIIARIRPEEDIQDCQTRNGISIAHCICGYGMIWDCRVGKRQKSRELSRQSRLHPRQPKDAAALLETYGGNNKTQIVILLWQRGRPSSIAYRRTEPVKILDGREQC